MLIAELAADPPDQLEHLAPPERVEPGGRLVEEREHGSWTSAWASFTRCFIPVEYVPIGR